MTESKFDKIQRFFLNALDRIGASYEILEYGCQPDNFYLKIDVDGMKLVLSEVDEEEDAGHDCVEDHECSCGSGCCKDPRETSISLMQSVIRNSARY